MDLLCFLVCPRALCCQTVGLLGSIAQFHCLYSLSVGFASNMRRAVFRLSVSEFVRSLDMTVPFMNPRNTESWWHDVRSTYGYVSVGFVYAFMSNTLDC